MSAPLNVTIVRPRKSLLESLVFFVVLYALGALVVTWLAPLITDGGWAPGYWQSMGVYALARTLFGDNSYSIWTKENTK